MVEHKAQPRHNRMQTTPTVRASAGAAQGTQETRDGPGSAKAGGQAKPPRQAADGRVAGRLDVHAALVDVTHLQPAELHRDAAYQWASRAVASFRVCLQKSVQQECLSYFYLGEHYREAALTHAAMGEQWEPMQVEVEAAMAKDRDSAFTAIQQFTSDGHPPPMRRGSSAPAEAR